MYCTIFKGGACQSTVIQRSLHKSAICEATHASLVRRDPNAVDLSQDPRGMGPVDRPIGKYRVKQFHGPLPPSPSSWHSTVLYSVRRSWHAYFTVSTPVEHWPVGHERHRPFCPTGLLFTLPQHETARQRPPCVCSAPTIGDAPLGNLLTAHFHASGLYCLGRDSRRTRADVRVAPSPIRAPLVHAFWMPIHKSQ
jgi:hypothetical protein